MKRILSTTAITAMLMAAPALAQDQSSGSSGMSSQSGSTTSGDIFAQVPADSSMHFGSDLIGSTVYTTMSMSMSEGGSAESGATSDSGSADSSAELSGGGAAQSPESIGEINDLIITQDGQVEYVIVGVGGFLGIGQRSVAVNMSALSFTPDPQNEGEMMITIPASQDEIENAPEFDRAALQPGGEGQSASGDASATSSSSGEQSNMSEAGNDAENAAENAGQATENAAEDAGQATENAAEDAAQSAQDAANEAGDAAQDAANSAENAAESTTDQAGQSMENAGESMQESTDSNSNN